MTRGTVMCSHESPVGQPHHPVEAGKQVCPGSLSHPDFIGEVVPIRPDVPYPAIRVHDAARRPTPPLEFSERSQVIHHFPKHILRSLQSSVWAQGGTLHG